MITHLTSPTLQPTARRAGHDEWDAGAIALDAIALDDITLAGIATSEVVS